MRVLGWSIQSVRGMVGGMRSGMTASEYATVVIPLEDAHLHSHSARMGYTEFDEDAGEASRGDDTDGTKDGEHESTGMLEMRLAEYSIE